MTVTEFLIEYMFYGLCLGAVMYLTSWFWSKGFHWLTSALHGRMR